MIHYGYKAFRKADSSLYAQFAALRCNGTSNLPTHALETLMNLRPPWRNFNGKSSMITGIKG